MTTTDRRPIEVPTVEDFPRYCGKCGRELNRGETDGRPWALCPEWFTASLLRHEGWIVKERR